MFVLREELQFRGGGSGDLDISQILQSVRPTLHFYPSEYEFVNFFIPCNHNDSYNKIKLHSDWHIIAKTAGKIDWKHWTLCNLLQFVWTSLQKLHS